MHRSLTVFGLLLVLHSARCQLPLGTTIEAAKLGSQALNLLPPGAKQCVEKVTTQAVTNSFASKFINQFGSSLGSAAPTITRDPGTFYCKDGVPYYKETAHLKGQITFLNNLPYDFPINQDTNLSTCFENGIPNPCALLGSTGGNLLNSITGANKPAPQATIGGQSLGLGARGAPAASNSQGAVGAGNPLAQLFQG